MEYISAKEAAERWGIQVRGVQELCKAGRIQGAFKFERSWMIPASAQKPEDPRRAGSKSSGAVSYGYYPGLISYFIHAPSGKSDRLPTGITDPAAILEYKAELLYFTGEIDACRDMLHGVDDGGTLLSRLSLVLPLSVCLGDVPAFNSAVEGVYALIDQAPDSVGSRAARLLHSCTALGLYMPHFVPEWIRDGQFAGLPAELIPFAIYTRSKYLLTAKREAEAKAAAETALSFLPVESGFSLIHLYLRLICSAALCAAGDMHASEAHLRETMSLAMPYDYVIPFTEFLTLHSGLIESGISGAVQARYTALDKMLEELDGFPRPAHHVKRNRHSLQPRAPSRPSPRRRSHLCGGRRTAWHERRQRKKHGVGHICQAPRRR